MNIVHVYPENDLAEHIVDGWEEGKQCTCRPREQLVDGGLVIVHNSWDGREIWEQLEERANDNPS